MEIKEKFISINKAAQMLSVTPATIFNWIKTGRITDITYQDNHIFLNTNEIQRIIWEVNNGKNVLKSRRNKSFISGVSIPVDYVSNSYYQKVINELVDFSIRISDPRIILMEFIIGFLYFRNKINIHLDKSNYSYIKAYQNSIKDTNEILYLILKDIIDFDQFKLSDSDLEIVSNIHKKIEISWLNDQDFLGLIYMSFSSIGNRKRAGSYYTSYRIVDELTNEVINQLKKKKVDYHKITIFDPCCGSGNFLIQLFLKIKKFLILHGFSDEQAEKVLLRNILHGNDIDPVAVTLTKLNLILCSNLPISEIASLNIYKRNTLSSHPKRITYDVIIGNPPWGSVISESDRKKYSKIYVSAKGACEPFALFIEKSLKILVKNGILAFVLPEAFLNIHLHQIVRQMILSNTTICSIKMRGNDFTKVFSPIITLVITKEKASSDYIFPIRNKEMTIFSNQLQCLNNQSYIIKGQTLEETKLIESMKSNQEVKFLRNNAKFVMGIVTGNNNKHILSQCPSNGEVILRGIDIYKYHYYSGHNYIVFNPAKYQQVASESLYRSKEKLIYRFINKSLVFAYDNNQTLSLNSANILIPTIDDLPIKYILAILNSRALQAFYSISFNSVKVLRQYLESLPIPPANEVDQNLIITYVDQLLQTSDPNKIKQIYDLIDEKVMTLFNLTLNQQQLIYDIVGKYKYLSP